MKRVSKPRLFRAGAASIATAIALLAIPASVSGATKPASYECRGAHPIYLNTSYSFAERAADLVSCMTLSQEVLQLHTNNAPAIPSLHMQPYWYWNEGQHGVNTMFGDTNNGNTPGGVHATSFPTNFASTMTPYTLFIYIPALSSSRCTIRRRSGQRAVGLVVNVELFSCVVEQAP